MNTNRPGLDAVKALYEESPYFGGVHGITQPDVLAAVGRFYGLPAAGPTAARVLELGCSRGENLGTIARRWPESSCVGVDFVLEEIEQARLSFAELGNVEFMQGDLREYKPPGGAYDYIICHGVFSWVDDGVKEAILKLCGEYLAPNGLAFVSYNTYPGWHWRESLRQVMMMPGANGAAERKEKALVTLDFMHRVLAERKDAQGKFLRGEVEAVQRKAQGILPYDELAPVNDPCYFLQFAEWAAEHGLSYVADSPMLEITPDLLPSGCLDSLAKLRLNRLEYEQLIDVAIQRLFRASVLCRTEVAGEVSARIDAVRTLLLETRMEIMGGKNSKRFRERATGRELEVNDPLARAMLRSLTEKNEPQSFGSLLEGCRAEGISGGSEEVALSLFFEAIRKGLVSARVVD